MASGKLPNHTHVSHSGIYVLMFIKRTKNACFRSFVRLCFPKMIIRAEGIGHIDLVTGDHRERGVEIQPK